MKLSVLIAGIFGTVGFVVSVLAGLMADNTFDSILLKALLSSGICYAVGYMAGSIGQVVTHEHAGDLAKRVAEHDKKVAAEKEEAERKAAAEAIEAAAVAHNTSPGSGG
jgi:hypothetical protein